MANDVKWINNRKMQLSMSLILLLVVIVITVWVYFYKSSLLQEKNDYISQISALETDIKSLNSNRSILVYNLVNLNNSHLEDLDKKSDINNIVSNIKILWDKFWVSFSNFYYKSWEITLNAFANLSGNELAYNKVSNFIWNFRWENNDIFELGHVQNVNWRDSMQFNVNFKLK